MKPFIIIIQLVIFVSKHSEDVKITQEGIREAADNASIFLVRQLHIFGTNVISKPDL